MQQIMFVNNIFALFKEGFVLWYSESWINSSPKEANIGGCLINGPFCFRPLLAGKVRSLVVQYKAPEFEFVK